ncbi:MAG: hypothetical protein SFU86_21970 [Pirellulaceae bacterium]|nr:hypothetical protein [Pirellulaceae bacterium]
MPETAQSVVAEVETENRTVPAVAEALAAIAADAQQNSAQYLADTVVPHGGE